MKLPNKSDVQAFLRRTTRPKTKLGKTTLWFGYLAAFLQALRLIFRPGANSMLTGWAGFIGVVFVFFAFLMGFRWVRRKLLWRLRNRLIVTYMFIGVIPVILLVAMAFITGYLFAGQFATYVAMSELQSDLQHLEATNRSMAYQFASMARNGKLTPELARDIATRFGRALPSSLGERVGGRQRLRVVGVGAGHEAGTDPAVYGIPQRLRGICARQQSPGTAGNATRRAGRTLTDGNL